LLELSEAHRARLAASAGTRLQLQEMSFGSIQHAASRAMPLANSLISSC
jgi:hypothetical protein